MSILGTKMTLDTIVETLVLGIGTLSGVHRLEILSYFACLSALVNYVVFMTFYPACLSLILELRAKGNLNKNINKSPSSKFLMDEKSNPIIDRVKIIMSAGLLLVHLRSKWPFTVSQSENDKEQTATLNSSDHKSHHSDFLKWVTVSADHLVILIILLALLVKFIFFENNEEITEQLQSVKRISKEQTQNSESSQTIRNRFNKSYFSPGSSFLDEQSSCKESKEIQTETFRNYLSLSEELEELNRFNNQLSRKNKLKRQMELDDNVFIESNLLNNSRLGPNYFKNYQSLEESDDEEVPRSLEECLKIYRSELGAASLSDREIILLVENKHIAPYQIEKAIKNHERGVKIRRRILSSEGNFGSILENLPYENYDFSKVFGACCENVVGYVPVPVGVAGPLLLDDQFYYIPMATTEGCLVASTNRGCRALSKCGVSSTVIFDGMTRGPVMKFPSMRRASEAILWIEDENNFKNLKKYFDSTSRFARLSKIQIKIAGRLLFIRFVATTGDAMGMNMVSKGTEEALKYMHSVFPDGEVLSLSGNFCTDKKASSVNWIEGRGKSVVCEAIVPGHIVTSILKSNVKSLVELNLSKNMIGSAIAGSIGGFNAHAANVVTAIFIATGQDPAQNVGSSNCITTMEMWGTNGEDLYISCTMPSIEIGTIGGGTILPAQSSCLEMLGVKGPNLDNPGDNAKTLARIVCGTVLAGELSLMAALSAGHLVKSHLTHNRSSTSVDLGGSADR